MLPKRLLPASRLTLGLVFGFGLALLSGCSSVPPELRWHAWPERVELSAAEVTLELEATPGGHLTALQVDAGAGPWLFLIDTGSRMSIVTPAFAEELDLSLESDHPYAFAGIGGVSERSPLAWIETLACRAKDSEAQVEFGGLWAAVLPISDLVGATETRFGGLLGAEVFRELLLTLDIRRGRLTLTRGQLPAPDMKTVLPLEHGAVPTIRFGELDGGSTFTLDTGYPDSFYAPADWVEELEVSPVIRIPGAILGITQPTGGAGPSVSFIGRLPGVALGRYTLDRPLCVFGPASELLVGCALLKEFTITFDFAKRRVQLRRTEDVVRFSGYRGTGVILQPRQGQFIVFDVVSGSAADGKLRAGDRVVSIAGIPIATAVRELDELSEGETLRYEVEREGRTFSVELAVGELLD